MNISVISTRSDVIAFLDNMRATINADDYDIRTGFYLIKKSKPNDEEHSTPYTLRDLGYDAFDVLERLKELTVKDYSETKFDRDDNDPPLLFIFGKGINSRLVYIKLMNKGRDKHYVLCVSFHYAAREMSFPYV